MAKHLNVSLGFTADTSLAALAIKLLLQLLTNLINNLGLGAKGFKLTEEIQLATRAAAELQVHLNNAMNQRTGNLDWSKLDASFKASGLSLATYGESLMKLGSNGKAAFGNLILQAALAEIPIRRTNTLLKEMGTTLMNSVRWQLSSSIIHGFMGSILRAYGYAQDLNESLNNIRIVTGQSTDLMALFAAQANKAAKNLSASTLDYTDAALIYYQLGLSDQLVKERTDVTVKMANVSRQSAEEVSLQMTAIWNNFAKGGENLEYYADVITALGAATASSSDEIATGLLKFAAIADTVGLSYENASAALATITATTRLSADTVGTGLRTLFSRLQGLSLGETLEDGVDLTKYTKALLTVGVLALDSSGNLRAMDDVLEDLAGKWQGLSEAQLTALAQTVGGVRQYTTLIALMDNWDFMEQNQLIANNAEGTLLSQADIYAESWEAAQKRVKASMEAIYDSLLNDDFFIGVTNAFEKILTGVNSFIKSLGGAKGVLLGLGTIFTKVFSTLIANGLKDLTYNLLSLTANGRKKIAERKSTEIQKAIDVLPPVDESNNMMQETAIDKGVRDLLALLLKLTLEVGHMSDAELLVNLALIARHKYMTDELALLGLAADKAKEIYAADAANNTGAIAARAGVTIRDGNRIRTLGFKDFSSRVTEAANYESAERGLSSFLSLQNGAGEFDKSVLSKIKDYIKEFKKDTKIDLGLEDDLTTAAALEKKLEAIRRYKNELNGNLANDYLMDLEDVDKTVSDKADAQDSEREYKRLEEDVNKNLEDTSKGMEHGIPHVKDYALAVTSAAGSLMQFGMVASSVLSIINTLGDSTASTTDKVMSVVTGIGMAVPMFLSSINGITNAFKTLDMTVKASTVGIVLLGITAAVTGLAIAISESKAQLPEAVYKRMTEAAQELKNESEEVKNKIEEIGSAFDSYDSAVDKLNECTEGSLEWKDALSAVNDEALNLLNNFPELGKLANLFERDTKNGILKINDEVRSLVETLMSELASILLYASLAAGNMAAQLNLDIQANDSFSKLDVYEYDAATDSLIKVADASDIVTENLNELANKTPEEFEDAVTALGKSLLDSGKLTETLAGLFVEGLLLELTAVLNLATATDNVAALLNNTATLLSNSDFMKLFGEGASAAATQKLLELFNLYLAEYIAKANEFSKSDKKPEELVNGLWHEYNLALGRMFDYTLEANAVLGTDTSRFFAYVDDEGKSSKVSAETVASTIAAAKALDELKANALLASTVLKELDEDNKDALNNYIATGSLEKYNRLQLLSFTQDENGNQKTDDEVKNSIYRAFGGEDNAKLLADIQGLTLDEFVDNFKTALAEAETALDTGISNRLSNSVKKIWDESVNDIKISDAIKNNETLAIQNAIADSLQKAFDEGGEGALNSLTEVFNSLQPKDLQGFLDALGLADWTSNNAISDLLTTLEASGITIGKAEDAIRSYGNAMSDAAHKAQTFKTRLDELRGTIASLNDIVDDIELGDVISDEDYEKLIEYDNSIKDLFMMTADGWQFIGDVDELNSKLGMTDALLLSVIEDMRASREDAQTFESSETLFDIAKNLDINALSYGMMQTPKEHEAFMNSSFGAGYNEDKMQEMSKLLADSLENGEIIDLAAYDEAELYIRGFYERLAQYRLAYENGEFDELSIEELKASLVDSIKKLERLLSSGSISQEIFDKALESTTKTEAENAGLDYEEVSKTADALLNYTEQLADSRDEANRVALAYTKMERGFDNLTENFDTWKSSIKGIDKDLNSQAKMLNKDYSDAIDGISDALSDMFNVSKEAFDSDFIEDNLDNIEKALNGEQEGIDNLQAALAKSRAIELGVDLNWDDANDEFGNLESMIDLASLEEVAIGTSLDDTNFAAGLVSMMEAAGYSATAISDVLSSINYSPTVTWTRYDSPEEFSEAHQSGTVTVMRDLMSEPEEVPVESAVLMFEGSQSIWVASINGQSTVKTAEAPVGRSGGGGRGGGGGGGGGGGSKAKDKKKLVDEQDRYHEVKEIIDDLSRQYDDLSNAKDRAFGTNKLKAMDAEKAKLQELANAELRYYNEALNYLAQDKKELDSYGYHIEYDEAGRISNYNDVIALAVNRFNKSARGDTDEENYKNFLDALGRYEESVNTAEEHALQIKDYYEQIYDLELERIQYTVEMQNDVAEDYLDILDHMLTMIEDDAFAAAEAMGMLGKQAELTLQQISVYRDGIEQILKQHGGLSAAELQAVLNGTATDDILNRIDLTEDEIEAIRDYQDALLEANEILKDLRDEVQEKLMDAFDAWNDKIEEGMDLFDHYGTILEEYDDIIGIVGKDMLGISDDLLQALDDALINNAIERLRGSKDIMDSLRDQEAHALQQLQYARETGSEQDIRLWEDTVREVQERTREAEEDMLSNWSDALDSAAEMFEDAVDRAVSAFEAGMSGGLGSLDALQDAFDQLKEIADRYVDDYKEIYELSKLNRDILNSIDDTDNVRAKKALRDLLKEINDLQEGDQEMSQYDLDYLRKKYELRLAELQLEEAQNAKSQVRMSRDSEGNWSYVYTADEDAVEKARLNVEDKLYEMLELNSEYIKEVLDGILQSQIDLTNALRDLDKVKFASDEEYYAEVARLTDYYNGLNQYYQDEMRKGLENNKTTYDEDWKNYSDLTGYKMSKDSEYLDSFDESIYSLLTGFDTLKEAQDAFATNTDLMVNDLRNAFRNWRATIEEAMRAADTSIARFSDDVYWSIYGDGSDTVPGIIGASDKAAEAVDSMALRMELEFNAALNAVTSWQDLYSNAIQAAIESNTAFVKSLEEIMRAQTNMLKGTTSANTITPNTNSTTPLGSLPSPSKNSFHELTTGDTISIKPGAKIYGNPYGWGMPITNGVVFSGTIFLTNLNGNYPYRIGQNLWIRKLDIVGYDTGGYTGDWNSSDGKLGILHLKELVLNAADTENLLNAISRVVDLNAAVQSLGLSMVGITRYHQEEQTLQQEVTIHAEFPNVSDHNEIELAMENLVNRASQFANRRN